ncbi:MAG: hypothetical protein FJ190_12235 [Gammaproteobacteria bacterium]|nr:hypothetical protein [Gammaproteobacteria bacterium]
MITLSNSDGDTLQFWVSGYQYPDPDGYYWDLNWLSVNVRWQRAEALWQASDPCLSTEELLDLLEWITRCEQEKPASESIEFMEPCLKFAWLTDANLPRLRLYLRYELYPGNTLHLPPPLQSATKLPKDPNQDRIFWLEFPLPDINLAALVLDLQAMIDQFPVRQERT